MRVARGCGSSRAATPAISRRISSRGGVASPTSLSRVNFNAGMSNSALESTFVARNVPAVTSSSAVLVCTRGSGIFAEYVQCHMSAHGTKCGYSAALGGRAEAGQDRGTVAIAGVHSSLTLSALMMGHHFSISAL
jgi:hypothetical protein